MGYCPWGRKELDMTEQLSMEAEAAFWGPLADVVGSEGSSVDCKRCNSTRWSPQPLFASSVIAIYQWLSGKESACQCNAGDLSSIPGSGISPGVGTGNSFQYSCLENPMDRGTWWATVHGVAKSWTRQSH